MKKLLILLFTIIPIVVSAQEKISVVTLKSGTELKGVIKSIDPTDALTIVVSGIETTIKMADVTKVEEEINNSPQQFIDKERQEIRDPDDDQETFVALSDNNRLCYKVLSKTNKTVEVIHNKNVKFNNSNLTIPSTVEYKGESYTVVAIGEEAFSKNTKIRTIKLPNTVLYIGEEAFCYCTKVNQIEFSSGLKEIGEKAFAFCIKLNEVELPQGLLKIEEQAFQTCPLEKIEIPNTVTFIGRRAFFSGNSFIGQESRIKWLSLPESVKEIGKQAFCKFINLMGTALPSKCYIEFLPSWLDENEAKRIGISEESFLDYKNRVHMETVK